MPDDALFRDADFWDGCDPQGSGARCWSYLDPQGVSKGPFTTVEMRFWHSAGSFAPDLPIMHTDNGNFHAMETLFPPPMVPFSATPAVEPPLSRADICALTACLGDPTLSRADSSAHSISARQHASSRTLVGGDDRIDVSPFINGVDGVPACLGVPLLSRADSAVPFNQHVAAG